MEDFIKIMEYLQIKSPHLMLVALEIITKAIVEIVIRLRGSMWQYLIHC